jgi:hypothetical protein
MVLTVLPRARAILAVEPSRPQTVLYVEGLPKSRLRWFGAESRRLSVRTSKIVGVRREDTDDLIRLADAAALSGQQPERAKLSCGEAYPALRRAPTSVFGYRIFLSIALTDSGLPSPRCTRVCTNARKTLFMRVW